MPSIKNYIVFLSVLVNSFYAIALIKPQELFTAVKQNNKALIEQFINEQKNSQLPSTTKNKALLLALTYGFLDSAQYLISHGADINALVPSMLPALHHAVQLANLKTLEFILNTPHASLNLQDKDGNTALHQAVMRASSPNNTHADKTNKALIELLVKHGTDSLIKNNNGKTALQEAARPTLKLNIINKDIIKLLIKLNKQALYAQDFQGNTVLHNAIKNTDNELIELLLELKAFSDVQNNAGETPLITALKAGFTALAEKLIDAGASITIQDKTGSTPLHIAVLLENPKLAAKLILHGAPLEIKNSKNFTPLSLAEQMAKSSPDFGKQYENIKKVVTTLKVAPKLLEEKNQKISLSKLSQALIPLAAKAPMFKL